jgi:hypothetical protein
MRPHLPSNANAYANAMPRPSSQSSATPATISPGLTPPRKASSIFGQFAILRRFASFPSAPDQKGAQPPEKT